MFITKAKFSGYSKKKTQINVTFSLPLDTDEMQLIQFEKSHGYLAFNSDEFKKKVEEFMKTKSIGVDKYGKSPSTKLRGEIFVAWEDAYKKGKTSKTADQFYIDTMEMLRNVVITKSMNI